MSQAKRDTERTAAPRAASAEDSTGLREPVPRAVRKPPGLSLLLVLLAALLPYLNSLENGFVLDDQDLILSNPYIQGGAAPGALFTTAFWERQNQGRRNDYRPVTMVSFALNHRVGGLETFSCHLTNLLLHILVCLLLLLVLRRVLPRGMLALAAALLFAVHPVHTEVVAAVGGRAELLAALFLFAAWLAHLVAWPLRNEEEGRRTWNWRQLAGLTLLGMGLFMLALLSAGSAAALLPAMLLGDLLRQKKTAPAEPPGEDDFFTPDRRSAWQQLATLGRRLILLPWEAYTGLLAVFVLYLALRQKVLGSIAGGAAIPFLDNPLASAETPVRLMTAVKVLGEYLRLQFWPASLSADYGYNQVKLVTSPADPGFLAAAAACIALLVGAAVLWRTGRGRVPALGILFFFCAIAPVSNIPFPIGTIMAERLLYLPSLGFCLVLASLFCITARELCSTGPAKNGKAAAGPHRGWLMIVLVLLIAFASAGRTMRRNRDWRDQQTLFLSSAVVSPDSARVHADLGVGWFGRGEYALAARSLQRALEIHPDYPLALHVLGRTWIELGEMERARQALARVAELRPDHPGTLLALGAVEFRLGHLEQATSLFRQVLDLDPENLWAMESLGISLNQGGRYEEAIQVFRSCLERRPDEPNSHFNLAAALRSAGRLEEAEAACRDALALDHGHQGSLITLADICRQTGREEEADKLRDRALGRHR